MPRDPSICERCATPTLKWSHVAYDGTLLWTESAVPPRTPPWTGPRAEATEAPRTEAPGDEEREGASIAGSWLRGRFRGRNLVGDLPTWPRQSQTDFVLQAADAVVFMVGQLRGGTNVERIREALA